MPKANSWIDPADFVETIFELTLKNVTTGSSDELKTGIEVIELQKAGLVLKLPKKAAASGHLVLLTISRKKAPQRIAKAVSMDLSVTAKITGTEEFQKDSIIATLQFYQYNEKEWETLLDECADRQRKSNDIVKRIQE